MPERSGLVKMVASAGLVLMLLLGALPIRTGLAQEGGGDIVITVRIVPATPAGTLTASLSSAKYDSLDPLYGAALALTVDDHRGVAYGWSVNVHEATPGPMQGAMWLVSQDCPTNDLIGQLERAPSPSCITWLGVGLSLEESVQVLAAAPGAGSGRTSTRFTVVPVEPVLDGSLVMIVSLPSAP